MAFNSYPHFSENDNNQESQITFYEDGQVIPVIVNTRPRILLRFKNCSVPNPPPSALRTDLKNAKVADSLRHIRPELLLDIGYMPQVVGNYKEYKAVAKTIHINQSKIRKEIEKISQNTSGSEGDGVIDLNKEYDRLLEKQVSGSDLQSRPKSISTSWSNSGRQEKPQAFIRVKENGIIYLKLLQQEFHIQRAVVVIPRLTQAELNAFLPSEEEEPEKELITSPTQEQEE